MPVTRLNEISPFTKYKSNRLRLQLANTGPGLVRTYQIPTRKKGGTISTVVLTEAGQEILDRLSVKYSKSAGHGGTEHKFWQYAGFRWAKEQGCKPEIERYMGGKSADVGTEQGEDKVALEIVISEVEKEIRNLILDMESGWQKVVFCALSDKKLNLLRNKIAEKFGEEMLNSDRIDFMKLSVFLDCKEYQRKTRSKSKEGKK